MWVKSFKETSPLWHAQPKAIVPSTDVGKVKKDRCSGPNQTTSGTLLCKTPPHRGRLGKIQTINRTIDFTVIHQTLLSTRVQAFIYFLHLQGTQIPQRINNKNATQIKAEIIFRSSPRHLILHCPVLSSRLSKNLVVTLSPSISAGSLAD